MSGFTFDALILLLAALPVFFSFQGSFQRTARALAAAVCLCLSAVLSALLYSNGGGASGSLGLYCALVFASSCLLGRSRRPLSRLYEMTVRSSASLFPLAIAYLLSAQRLEAGRLFGWLTLLLMLLFALPATLVPRFLSKGSAPGELELPDERPISPGVVMLILELGVPASLIFGLSAPVYSALMLIICLAVLLLTESLWCQAALFALHLSALPRKRQQELEYMVKLGSETSEQLRRQAAEERSARAIGEARLYAMENSLLGGMQKQAFSSQPPAGGELSFCAYPMIDSLMRRCREGAAARGITADIFLRLSSLCGFSESELCVLFHLAVDPVLSAPALPGAGEALIRIRATEESGRLALSVGCRGLSLGEEAGDALASAASRHGGWAECAEANGFTVLSLVLFG